MLTNTDEARILRSLERSLLPGILYVRMNGVELRDQFGRQIRDLRISVTDRCNFACVYCKSANPKNYFPHHDLLTWSELLRS